MVSNSQSSPTKLEEGAVQPRVKRDLKTKILAGVGSTNTYEPVLDLIGGLRFPQPEITLLHAVDTTYPIANADAQKEKEYAKVMENLGTRILGLAKTEAQSRDLDVRVEMVFGRAADCLIAKANREETRLIALCATKHGDWGAGYVGSAACALALNATQSLLVAKAPVRPSLKLRAVLGIDHSTKVNRLLQNLLDLAPQGIEEIMIVSAYEINDETAQAAHENLPMLGGDVDRSLQELFTEKNLKLVDLLNESGYRTQQKVVCSGPADALRTAMKQFHADLLIVGGVGDSSPAMSKIGSVALHQVISEPYSVLVLRG